MLKGNNIEVYSAHNNGKLVAERFIRNLKNKIYKYMTSISKNVFVDKLDDVFNGHNNTYSIKMKPADLKSSMYIDFEVQNNNKSHKLELGDYVRISKYKNIFAKGYTPKWSEEVFVIEKVKSAVPWTHVTEERNGHEIVRTFNKIKLQKTKLNSWN